MEKASFPDHFKSVRFTDTRPPSYKGYPTTDVFRRATWERDGKTESIVARGPAGTSAAELDEILTAKCREIGAV